jgi:hypothetical protein
MMGRKSMPFPRREVATRRVEWAVQPPQVEAGEQDYDRYENDRLAVMKLIEAECGRQQPHDLRVIEGDDETVISYEIQRVVLKPKR